MDERRLIAPFFVEVNYLPVFHHTITSYFVIPFSVECRHNRASSFQPIINSERHREDSSDDRSDIIRLVFSVKHREIFKFTITANKYYLFSITLYPNC